MGHQKPVAALRAVYTRPRKPELLSFDVVVTNQVVATMSADEVVKAYEEINEVGCDSPAQRD